MKLIVKDHADDEKDMLMWVWAAGAEFAHASTVDPSTTATYALCVYDSVGSTPSLAASIEVAPGAAWTDNDPKGWKYKDATLASDGVLLAMVKAGKTKVLLKAKGLGLPLPAAASVTQFFAKDTEVTAQLVNSQTGTSWTSAFPVARKNTPTLFIATTP